ncbi:SMP-30/gluconolactonase/LRE family protein [Gordonia hongkongensis]|uniref:SMP-30/gluconolactonase/LRE family protein n=1 Tax=Gordonia hongkongensis TaxID=1701090 RepID=UPI003D736383
MAAKFVNVPHAAGLGEGPVWDSKSGCVYWVDIPAGSVLRTQLATGTTDVLWSSPEPATSVALTDRGTVLVSLMERVVELADDGTVRVAADVASMPEGFRLNDCGVDPNGGYWVGSLNHQGLNRSGLYKLTSAGTFTKVLSDVTIANGMDWSPCGRWMYFVDSAVRVVWRFAFDLKSGMISSRTGQPMSVDRWGGEPDGLWVDSEGAIWIALWDGGSLLRFSRWDDSKPDVITVPGARPTSGAFVGPLLDRLFLTMAGQGDDTVPAVVLSGLGVGRLPSRVKSF